jgi:hypothetical protein
MTTEDLDFERRVLCPDGRCVGVLDETGHCPLCGSTVAAGSSHEPRTGPATAHSTLAFVELRAAAPAEGTADDLDIEQRALCPDGNCIGVLGADGRCKVCGASAR